MISSLNSVHIFATGITSQAFELVSSDNILLVSYTPLRSTHGYLKCNELPILHYPHPRRYAEYTRD